MANSRLTLNNYYLLELKSQIALKLYFPIVGKADCAKLSEILLKEGYGSISETTLYRLFVNFYGKNPYQYTLNILSNYIGFASWEDFITTLESNNYSGNIILNKPKQATDSLLFHCIANENYKSLHNYFDDIQNKDHSFKVNVALDVYDSLLKIKKPELFFEEFIQNKFIKEYVLEDGFDPAFRIENYDYAYKLYSNEINTIDSITTMQDFVFSQSVLFRYFFISNKLPEALQIGGKIFDTNLFNSEDLEKIFIFPKIRFKAYKLWYLELTDKSRLSIEDYANEILEYCKYLSVNQDSICKKIIFHTVAEVFCHSSLSLKYHQQLKNIFLDEFSKLPKNIFQKPLHYSLPYFSANGLLLYRPINL